MKILLKAIPLFFTLTLVTGIVYPVLMTFMAQVAFSHKANGSIVMTADKKVVGSELIAQKFIDPKYFWPRPSASDYNPLGSGGSNLSQTSKKLQMQVEERLQAGLVDELLFASASGLDPDISPEAALAQVPRIAQERQFDAINTRKLERLVEKSIMDRQYKFLGEPRVNVLKLNLALIQDFEHGR